MPDAKSFLVSGRHKMKKFLIEMKHGLGDCAVSYTHLTQTAPCGGTGPNLIRPQTCFSDFRSASKASFETPGEYASLAARKETSASRPHPPPKGHACLIRMRQYAAFGPPPWWGGSTLRVELRGKTRRQVVVRIRNALLNIIIAIIPQIEF